MGCGAAELTVCVVPWSEAGLEAREDLDSMRRTHTHAEADADAREVWVQGSRLRAQGCAQGASGHVLRRLVKHAPLAPSAICIWLPGTVRPLARWRHLSVRWRVGAICIWLPGTARPQYQPSASGVSILLPMWGQGPVVVDDSPPPEEGTQAVVANPGGVATASPETQEMDRLENEMQNTLGGMCDAFAVNLPFTTEDKKRIVENLKKLNDEYEEGSRTRRFLRTVDQDVELRFTRTVLKYMLKELRDVFGETSIAFSIALRAAKEANADEEGLANRTQEANADEEGLAGRKRQRSLPATRYRATRYATG